MIFMNHNDSLYHYGVKGMKWGVRRDIKKRSIQAARLERKASRYYQAQQNSRKKSDDYAKKSSAYRKKLGGRIKTTHQYNKALGLDYRRAKNYTKSVEHLVKRRDIERERSDLIKDLSPKDVENGRKYVSLQTGRINVLVGGIYNLEATSRGERMLQDYISERQREEKGKYV